MASNRGKRVFLGGGATFVRHVCETTRFDHASRSIPLSCSEKAMPSPTRRGRQGIVARLHSVSFFEDSCTSVWRPPIRLDQHQSAFWDRAIKQRQLSV